MGRLRKDDGMGRLRERRWVGVAAGVVTYAAALAVAIGAGLLVASTQWAADAPQPLKALVVVAAADLAATAFVFAVSVLLDNSSMYDPYWSLQPLAIAAYYVWLRAADAATSSLDVREVLVVLLVALYSLRLTSNFYRDWPGLTKEDFRYVGFRRRFGRLYWPVSFFGIHLFPTVMVYLGCLPLYAAIVGPGSAFGVLDVVAAAVTLGAVALAFVADEQLRRFRRDPGNAGETIRSGLWSRSRHPNYLGEVATWWGLYVFALAAGGGWWWTGAGATAITLLFVFVSVPMMERRALATRRGYAEYMAGTPRFLPVGAARGRTAAERP